MNEALEKYPDLTGKDVMLMSKDGEMGDKEDDLVNALSAKSGKPKVNLKLIAFFSARIVLDGLTRSLSPTTSLSLFLSLHCPLFVSRCRLFGGLKGVSTSG